MEKEKVITEEMRQTIEQVNVLHEKLIPTVEELPYDISEMTSALLEMVNSLKTLIDRKSKPAPKKA